MPPVVVLACEVLAASLERALPPGLASRVIFLDPGLHRVPLRLAGAVQSALDEIGEPSLVAVGFGLCGNGLKGIRAGRHTLVMPRTDDCIAIILGSRAAYAREFGGTPGTYYVTKGWLESGSHPLKEYQEYLPRYGPEETMWILDQQYRHYERLALVAPSSEEMAACRESAREVARFCERWGMRYQEIVGSDEYIVRLIDRVRAMRGGETVVHGDADFLVIPPGGEIRQEMFIC